MYVMKVRKEIWIGLFVTCTIVLFIWGVTFLKGKTLFGTSQYVWAQYDRIDNLVAANPVFLNGYKIGQVAEVHLNPQTLKVDVKIIIKEPVKIPQASVARIVSADLMGTKAIELIFSNLKVYVQNGDTLKSAIEESLKESFNRQLAPIQAKTERFLLSIDSVLAGLQDVFAKSSRIKMKSSLESLHNTLLELEKISVRTSAILSESNSHINATTTNIFQFTEQLKQQKDKLGPIMDHLKATSDSLSHIQWNTLAGKIQSDANRLDNLLQAVQQKKGTLGKLVYEDSLYTALNALTQNLNTLVSDLKAHPGDYVHVSVFGKKDRATSKSKKTKSLK